MGCKIFLAALESTNILKGTMNKGKLLGGKKQWIHEKVDKISDEFINKAYTEYSQPELNEKDRKTGKWITNHVINWCSINIFKVIKTKDLKKLQQDESNDPIIRDQGCQGN